MMRVQGSSKQAAGCSQIYVRGEVVLRVHTIVHVQVYCVSGIPFLYRHKLDTVEDNHVSVYYSYSFQDLR